MEDDSEVGNSREAVGLTMTQSGHKPETGAEGNIQFARPRQPGPACQAMSDWWGESGDDADPGSTSTNKEQITAPRFVRYFTSAE